MAELTGQPADFQPLSGAARVGRLILPNHPCARGRWRCCRFVTPAAEPRNPLSYRQEIDDGEAVFFLPAGNSARISLTLLVAYVLA
jgi:hypothetical protein